MKLKYILMIALCSISGIAKADVNFDPAPWTKGTIVNNTKFPIKVSVYYSVPNCKLTDLMGSPCSVQGGMCDYRFCMPKLGRQYTLKPSKSSNILNPTGDVIDGEITPLEWTTYDSAKAIVVDTLVIELNNANVKPVTIQNPTQKQYIVTFDGKTLSVK